METLLGKTLVELQDVALAVGLPRYAGKQLAQWLYQKRVSTIDEMTNISKQGREALKQQYKVGRSAPVAEACSADGTKKYLFSVSNGEKVESVYIPEDDRATLCVSSQTGCKMGCKFCMTGTLGFHGNLTAADILNQIFSIPDSLSLTNIVYMGEGEPCDNVDAVLRSVEVLTAAWGCAWSPRRITISSIGYIPYLQTLIEGCECHIAISLHNPFAQERSLIMPIEKVYPIYEVINLLEKYDWSHQRRISFEYICFGMQNDTMRHAQGIKHLLKGLPCRINLIRFHENPDADSQTTGLHSSNLQQMEWLRDWLTDNGITTTIRRSRGEDIWAACGMLVSKNNNI